MTFLLSVTHICGEKTGLIRIHAVQVYSYVFTLGANTEEGDTASLLPKNIYQALYHRIPLKLKLKLLKICQVSGTPI